MAPRISLLIGVCAVCVGALVGVTFGLLSGFKGGAWDNVIMRITDVQLAIPFLILALAVIAILGNGLVNVVMVIGLTSWMLYARTVRAEVMSIKNQDFVLMAKAMGVSETKIMLRHILPNVSSSIIVISSLQVARVILFEASRPLPRLGRAAGHHHLGIHDFRRQEVPEQCMVDCHRSRAGHFLHASSASIWSATESATCLTPS